MNNIVLASDANDVATKKSAELKKALSIISKEAKKGKFSTTLFISDKGLPSKLKSLGYTIIEIFDCSVDEKGMYNAVIIW